MIQKIRSYFVRKRANKLRNEPNIKSLHEYEKSYYDACDFIDKVINTPTEKAAYLLAESDGFKESPEAYWLQAEDTIKKANEYRIIITKSFINLTTSTRKHYKKT